MNLIPTLSDIVNIAHYKHLNGKSIDNENSNKVKIQYRFYEDGEISKTLDDNENIILPGLRESYKSNLTLNLPMKMDNGLKKTFTYAVLEKEECIKYRNCFENILNNVMTANL